MSNLAKLVQVLSKGRRELSEGYSIGVSARELFTALRITSTDVWETEDPASPWYVRAEPLKLELPFLGEVGVFLGQLRHPLEWYRNAEYLFGGYDNEFVL